MTRLLPAMMPRTRSLSRGACLAICGWRRQRAAFVSSASPLAALLSPVGRIAKRSHRIHYSSSTRKPHVCCGCGCGLRWPIEFTTCKLHLQSDSMFNVDFTVSITLDVKILLLRTAGGDLVMRLSYMTRAKK